MTTENTTTLALKKERPMMQRVREALKTGMLAKDSFSGTLTYEQERAVALMAIAYGLDPFLGELVLLHGKPVPTIKAMRRKNDEAGHHPSIRFRTLTEAETRLFLDTASMEDGDLVLYCVLTTEWGNTVEGIGKVTRKERNAKSKSGEGPRSPVVADNPLEMAEKRAEFRAREMAYGGLALPTFAEFLAYDSADGIAGTETSEKIAGVPSVVEGAVVTARPGYCAMHNIRLAKLPDGTYAHKLKGGSGIEGGEWCNGVEKAGNIPEDEDDRFSANDLFPTSNENGPSQEPGIRRDPVTEDQLQEALADTGSSWEKMEEFVLRMPWAEWVKLGGTVQQAWLKFHNQ